MDINKKGLRNAAINSKVTFQSQQKCMGKKSKMSYSESEF